jgi:cyclopropane fatty-acyl-phospholipid synthase-like methyltransferase
MFTKKEIATYYNHTLLHYRVGWQLDKSKGLHYGLWYPDTKNLHEAIQNTNKKIGSFIKNKDGFDVLDAGCGVGGSAIFLAQNYHCNVHGITLSKAQLDQGNKYLEKTEVRKQVQLSVQDYSQTSFDNESFDLVFGIESFCHSDDKSETYKEAYRLLRPGGQLVIIDSIKTAKGSRPENRKTLEWLFHRWAISDLDDGHETVKNLKAAGFDGIDIENLTNNARKSINIIYRRAFWGLITIPLYWLVYQNKYGFTRRHPESGWALHKCFRNNLLEYVCISATKPTL